MRIPFRETLITVICVATLFALGTWQVKRLEWKNDIIQKLNAQYNDTARAVPFDKLKLDDLAREHDPMAYGAVKGRLLRDQSILLGPRIEDGRAGFHLLIPVATENGRVLIVNAGWVNDLWQDNIEDRLSTLPASTVTLRGIMHKPDWSNFASNNSPANDMWFRADIEEIAAAKELESPYPFILYADHTDPALYDVKPHEEKWLPRNKHLQYALFWYTLALAMMGVYGFYLRSLDKK